MVYHITSHVAAPTPKQHYHHSITKTHPMWRRPLQTTLSSLYNENTSTRAHTVQHALLARHLADPRAPPEQHERAEVADRAHNLIGARHLRVVDREVDVVERYVGVLSRDGERIQVCWHGMWRMMNCHVGVVSRERERDRERHRDRETETGREIDRQT